MKVYFGSNRRNYVFNRRKRILNLTEGFYTFWKRKRIPNLLERNYAFKTYFESNRGILRFLKEKIYTESTRKKLRFRNTKTYSWSAPWTMGYIMWNCRSSFANKPGEGIRAILDRWIESGHPKLDRRERERESHQPEKKTGAAELHYRRREAPWSTWFGP